MATRAELLFDQILNAPDRCAFLHNLILPTPRIESEILDYKAGAKLKPGDVRRIWAKALSGFGNTEGGVVVWGIDARKTKVPDANGVERMLDMPQAADLHPDPLRFAQELRDLLRDATEHPVLGVRIEPVIDPAASGAGFVVCFVPSGADKPYRSAVEHIYYMRVQDGFNPLPHTMLRAMFYPIVKARFALSARVHFGNAKSCALYLSLHNTGNASARQLIMDVRSSRTMDQISGDGQLFGANLGGLNVSRERLIGIRDLHPGDDRHIGSIGWSYSPEDPPFELGISLYAADREPTHFRLTVSMDLLRPNAAINIAEYEPGQTQ